MLWTCLNSTVQCIDEIVLFYTYVMINKIVNIVMMFPPYVHYVHTFLDVRLKS